MTAPALDLSIWNRPDSAYGDEAKSLRRMFDNVTDGLDATETFGQPFRALDSAFADASVEDWDGEGATAADRDTYILARAFLRKLPVTVPSPSISIDPDGEASFTWAERRDMMFSVSIGRDGTLSFAGLYGSKSNYGTESFVGQIPQTIRDNLARLFPQGAAETAGSHQ